MKSNVKKMRSDCEQQVAQFALKRNKSVSRTSSVQIGALKDRGPQSQLGQTRRNIKSPEVCQPVDVPSRVTFAKSVMNMDRKSNMAVQ